MNVEDYVRTDMGDIGKITKIIGEEKNTKDCYLNFKDMVVYGKEEDVIGIQGKVIKSSPNIIDLIEESDVLKLLDVNYDKEYKAEVILDYNDNLCVIDFENNKIIDLKSALNEGNIKILAILTHEQFETNAYKVGE